jgi:release factor glutamine methyltransferase
MSSSNPTNENLSASQLAFSVGSLQLDLEVPDGVWNPTPNGILLAEVLESMDFSGESILELGTGCGLHAIILGLRGAREMLLTEIDDAILTHARRNLDSHGVETKTRLLTADWIQVEAGGFDSLVANPPYCVSGKHYRRYYIDTLILESHKLVRPGGRIIFIHSTMADVPKTISQMEDCGISVRILAERDYPFRDYYFDDPSFILEMAKVHGSYTVRDGVHHERLVVFEGTLPEN